MQTIASNKQRPFQRPIKKFSQRFQIALQQSFYLARKQRDTMAEHAIIPKALKERFVRDVKSNRMYVRGSALPPVEWNLHEVWTLFDLVDVRIVDRNGKRLRDRPIFANYVDKEIDFKSVSYVLRAGDYAFQENLYGEKLQRWKESVKFSIDNLADGVWFSYECLLCLYLGLLRFDEPQKAFDNLVQIVRSERYQGLNPGALYAFYFHLHTRGLAPVVEELNKVVRWRSLFKTLDGSEQDSLLNIIFSGGKDDMFQRIIEGYYHETVVHSSMMQAEMGLLRWRTPHDRCKFAPDMIVPFAFHWGIADQMTAVQQYRARSGMPTVVYAAGEPTMERVTDGIVGAGLSSLTRGTNAETVGRVAEDAGEHLAAGFVSALSEPETAEQIRLLTTQSLEPSLEAIKKGGMEAATEHASRLKTLFAPLLDSSTRLTSSMNDMVDWFKGMIDKIKSFLPSWVQNSTSSFSMKAMCDAFVYYLLFMNIENRIMRAGLVVLMLYSLGLLPAIVEFGEAAFEKVVKYFAAAEENESAEEEKEEATGEPTSGFDWLSSLVNTLFSSVKNLWHRMTSFVTLIFCSAFSGFSISKVASLGVLTSVVAACRNLHFVGAGMFGIERIVKYAGIVFSTISKFVKKHVLGWKDEGLALEKDVARWIILVQFFLSEAGMSSIRASKRNLDLASSLFPKGQGFLSQSAIEAGSISHPTVMAIHRYLPQARELANFCLRVRASSSFKQTMFHVQFVGRPGVGKSKLMQKFVGDFVRMHWPGQEHNAFWSYNPNVEHFDGYEKQKVMIIDDVFRMNDPKHLTLLIGLITNTPVLLPMAHLEQKGEELDSEMLVSSTNTAYPIGKDVFCMEAVHRRRHLLVSVNCDPDVRDESTGQFCPNRFAKKYPGQNSLDYPHLTFDLLRPVPSADGNSSYLMLSPENQVEIERQMKLLSDANSYNYGEECYFSESMPPPSGVDLPARNLTFNQFMAVAASSYRSLRQSEGAYVSKSKFEHVQTCFAEIDQVFSQTTEVPGGMEFKPHRLIERAYLSAQMPYGAEDEFGRRLRDSPEDVQPMIDSIDIESIVNEVVATTSGEPTVEIADRLAMVRKRALASRSKDPTVLRVEGDRIVIPDDVSAIPWPTSIRGTQTTPLSVPIPFADNLAFVSYLEEVRAIPTNSSIGRYLRRLRDSQMLPGTKVPLIIAQRIKWVNGERHFDVSDLRFNGVYSCTLNGDTRRFLPVDIALLLATDEVAYVALCEVATWDEATTKRLSELARWQLSFMGSFSVQGITRVISDIRRSVCSTVMAHVYNLVAWLKARFLSAWNALATGVVFLATIYGLRSLARMILGPVRENTSRFLHRPAHNVATMAATGVKTFALAKSGMQQTDIANSLLKRNVRAFQVRTNDGAVYNGHGIHSGSFIYVNSHILELTNGEPFILSYAPSPMTDKVWEVEISPQQCVSLENTDFGLIYSRNFHTARSVDMHFIKAADFDKLDNFSELWTLTTKDGALSMEARALRSTITQFQLRDKHGKVSTLNRALLVAGNTVVGQSGSLLMAPNRLPSDRVILGLQAWKVYDQNEPMIAYQAVTQEMLETAKEQLSKQYDHVVIHQMGPVNGTPTCKVIPDIFHSHVQPVGTVSRDLVVGLVGKSKFKRTPIARFMELQGYTSLREPAALLATDPRLNVKVHPLRHSLNKYGKGKVGPFPQELLDRAVGDLSIWIGSRLDKSVFRADLSIEECITGLREPGSNPMDVRASPGIPYILDRYPGKLPGKKEYFRISDDGMVEYLDHNFHQQFESFYASLLKGVIPYHTSYDFPKDELRPILKVRGDAENDPRTRSVTCMNMCMALSWRRITLDLMSALHRLANGTFPFCPGMNPEGPDWTRAYFYLNKHPNAIDFDVANWDGHMPPELLFAVIDLIINLMHIPKTDPIARALYAIATEVLFGYVQWDDIVYQKFRGLISGFPGTAETNSLAHMLLILLFYIMLAIMHGFYQYANLAAFLVYVSYLVYGDDVIITFADEIKAFFNGKTIAWCYKRFGYPVTMADKTTAIPAFRKLHECTFLKSGFRVVNALRVDRTLDLGVGVDLLYWVRAKDDPQGQFRSNLFDAARLWHGHGKAVYDEWLERLNIWLKAAHQPPLLLSYREFEDEYRRIYYGINPKQYVHAPSGDSSGVMEYCA